MGRRRRARKAVHQNGRIGIAQPANFEFHERERTAELLHVQPGHIGQRVRHRPIGAQRDVAALDHRQRLRYLIGGLGRSRRRDHHAAANLGDAERQRRAGIGLAQSSIGRGAAASKPAAWAASR